MTDWTIRSFYAGKKKSLEGLSFPTNLSFYNEAFAEYYADLMNSMRQDRWPGHEFEFRAVPLSTEADSPK